MSAVPPTEETLHEDETTVDCSDETPALDVGTIVRSVLGPAPVAKREHLLEALCLSIASDGEVQTSELSALRDVARAIPGIPAARVRHWMERLARSAAEVHVRGPQTEEIGALEERMKDEPRPAREEALAVATLVQYVDGELSSAEETFLNALAQALDLTLEEAQRVVERVENAVARVAGQRSEKP